MTALVLKREWERIATTIASACSGNLAELMEGYFRTMESFYPEWRINARRMYGCRGFLTLKGAQGTVHEAILIKFHSHENPFPWTAKLDYRIVRKGTYKYIRWIRLEDEGELYYLEQNPYELNNLVNDPAMSSTISEMKDEMRMLVLDSLNLAD